MPTRTFLDSCVLIEAWRGKDDPSNKAFSLLNDRSRDFVSTRLVAIETQGHARFNRRQDEVEFYEDFFTNVVYETLEVTEDLVAEAMTVAETTDAQCTDALHLAAAIRLGASQFITTERISRPMYRESRLSVVHLDSA